MIAKRTILAATLFCVVAAAPGSAQIIATSSPSDVQSGQLGHNWRLHLMGGYGSWGATGEFSGGPRLSSFIVAGDSAFHTRVIDYGLGGWFNRFSDGGGNVSSVYGNAFYKHVGVQAGLIIGGGSTDPIMFLVGRTGGEHRASASAGVGFLSSSGTKFTAYGNVSYRLVNQLSLDASLWYLAFDADNAINRLSIGAGYTF